MFGLKQKHIELIIQCFTLYPEIEKVIIYGSCAISNYKPGSDIDLTIIGNLNYKSLLKLENQLDDLMLPYKIDLSLYNQISNQNLIINIQLFGEIFYDKNQKP